jgi:eukaryotic-like serine/threonine-protein kinase
MTQQPPVIGRDAAARLRETLGVAPLPGRYQLIDILGEGGMGVVWRAHDSVLDRDVAIKILAPHLDGDELELRLAREARILAALEHPGIVPVYDVGSSADGSTWYAMRLVRGIPLDAAARDGRDRRDLLRIVEQLCDTVAYAHAHGVVHRDLKPRNVMLGPFGEVLVLDWGVARDGSGEHTGMVVGTPGFMSPEQADGRPADVRSDVYGLGAILGELVGIHADPVPGALTSIVARALDPTPANRYSTPLELREELRRFAARDRVLAHKESLIERIQRFTATHQTAILLIATYIVMRLAILIWRGI